MRVHAPALLAVARVVQPRLLDALDIDVTHDQVLAELRAARDERAALVADQAVTIEDQLVLPPTAFTLQTTTALSLARVAIIRSRKAPLPR